MVRIPERLANSLSVRFNSSCMNVLRDVADVGMSEGVIPDLVAFFVDTACDIGVFVGLNTNNEEGRRSVLFLQDIENFWRPLRVRSVIEGQSNCFGFRP